MLLFLNKSHLVLRVEKIETESKKGTPKCSTNDTTILSNLFCQNLVTFFSNYNAFGVEKEKSDREQITRNIRNEKIRIPNSDDVTAPQENLFSSHALENVDERKRNRRRKKKYQ